MKLQLRIFQTEGDLSTPLGIYLALRDRYPGALLFESSDYHSATDSSSFICLDPIASFRVIADEIRINRLDDQELRIPARKQEFINHLLAFLSSFETTETVPAGGLYGYIGYDMLQYFEDVNLNIRHASDYAHPGMAMSAYRFVLHLNHFNDSLTIYEFIPDGTDSQMDKLLAALRLQRNLSFPFGVSGAVESNMNDEFFLDMVNKAKQHCYRGDVFQLVVSRRFQVGYTGDDFNVYRALRRINPSPYLFYLDYGHYRIFGSSPESQLRIRESKVSLNPIAGTYRRTGHTSKDAALAEKLSNDPKENAEHAMLVDLARNDLSRSCKNVSVETFKEVQYFSHVIHLVSKVSGTLRRPDDVLHVVADTFPAGTLSGAPKVRAMELIDAIEPQSRGFYGGAAGFIGFNGDVNLAILIRSFLSIHQKLYFQAGAGVVAASVPENELQEVNNKLAALNNAFNVASKH
ncbi:MAG: anthranilate synthase component I family protein [Bacteroidia bacterium]|jgi:anthranilate synthase component 1|nr:anthranilate synthase component I family protein [Bacteroidia bacterium]